MFDLNELATETGEEPNTLRMAATLLLGPGCDTSQLAAGDALLLLLHDLLLKFGFPPPVAGTICIRYKNQILQKIGPALHEGSAGPCLLVIQDNRWVVLELDTVAFDVNEQEDVPAAQLPFPIVYCGVGLAALYQKTLSKIQNRHSEEATVQFE